MASNFFVLTLILIIPDELLKVCNDNFKILYIVADSGLGKTSILNKLVYNYNYIKFIFISCNILSREK